MISSNSPPGPAVRLLRALALVGSLAACEYRRDIPIDAPPPPPPVATVAADHASIDLRFSVITDVDPRVGAACKDGVSAALRRHGFVLGSGTRVAVEIVVTQDPTANAFQGSLEPHHGVLDVNAPIGMPSDASQLAELSARVEDYARPVRVGGSGQGVACAVAAERLAAALVEAFGGASRSAPAR